MTDDKSNPENHTLALLREMRVEIAGRFDTVDEHLVNIEVRLTGIDQTTGALLTMYGAQNARLDKLEADMARVKRRLELADES